MAERSAEVDQMKGATLEQISSMVEEIGKEFKSKQSQLNPLMAEVKVKAPFRERLRILWVAHLSVLVVYSLLCTF
jgi:hypothetical protein